MKLKNVLIAMLAGYAVYDLGSKFIKSEVGQAAKKRVVAKFKKQDTTVQYVSEEDANTNSGIQNP